MSKRKSLSRRSSKSSRYTGSAILDPDTDVIDSGAYPYWWKNLENNTIGRPSIDFNMANETSRQLDSNSQIVSNESENEWWKVLDTSDSSEAVKPNTKQAKSALSTSESEEEPRIIKRKLPLRSRTKTHQDNAFLNALNESKETTFSEPIPRKDSSLNKPEAPNKAFSDSEQMVGASDSTVDLSLSSNDILKSKPKIFKQNYKNRDENVFVDVLQSNEFKVPFRKKPVGVISPKITEQKDSSKVEAPLYNRSRSMEYTLSFEGSHDLLHLSAPKAQSTTLEDSTPYNSNKSDSISDIDHKIVKPKPKLLQRRSRRVKKNVFQDIFENENTDDEAEKSKSISKNVVENIKISKRSLRPSSNKLLKPSQEPSKDIANEENNETEENKVSRAKTKRQSAIIATENISRSSERISLNKNDSLDKSLNISTPSVNIAIQPDVSVKSQRRITSVQSETSNSPKRKSTKKKSVLSQNLIGDENNEYMSSLDQADVSQLLEEVPNKLQRRSIANISSSSNKQKRKNTESQDRVSSRTRSSVLSMKETTQTNTNVSYVDNIREPDEKASEDADNNGVLNKLQYIDEERENISRRSTANVLSSSNRKERRNTENLSRVSSRAANLASSVNKILDMDPSTKDTDDESKSDIEEETLYDPTNEVTSNKLKFADQNQKNTSAGSTINKTSRSNRIERRNTENRSRVSIRRSNLVLSMKEMTQFSMRVSNANDKGIRETEDEDSTDVNDEEVPNTQYADKEQKNASQRSTINKSLRSSMIERRNTENGSRVSSRRSNLMLSTKEMTQSNMRVSNAGDKGLKKIEDEDSTDVNDEEAPNTQYADKEQINISEVSTINNLSGNRKVHKDAESRASNLDVDTSSDDFTTVEQQEDIFERRSVASISDVHNEDGNDTVNNLAPIAKRVNRMSRNTSNVADKEAEEGILHAYTPRKLHRPWRYTNVVQKMSTANVSSALNRKESVGVASLGRLSNRTSNLLPPFVSSPTVQGTSKAKLQTTIRNFFSVNRSAQVSGKQLFLDEQNGERIRSELEMIKKREMDRMNAVAKKQTEVLSTVEKKMNKRTKPPKTIRNKIRTEHIHKAYLVNGKVYKVPRLPRPKAWVTDRLYKYLWKVMEPKYKLETRVMSEKFVRQLSEVTTSIAKQKSYNNYKGELYALMKEMARLGIIRTRNDFYNFCHDFFPYELRFKMVPMLLPGNNRNIPYNPNKLHEPILD